MKQIDAEREISQIRTRWDEPEDKFGLHFGLFLFGWLEKNRPDLLKFRYSGDKYQKINSWVMRWQHEKSKH